jgi:hypothetical protein
VTDAKPGLGVLNEALLALMQAFIVRTVAVYLAWPAIAVADETEWTDDETLCSA